MIEALKALVVVFALALGAFVYARIAFSQIVDAATIDRWRNIFLAVTVAAFLLPNFWVVLFAISVIAVTMGAAEKFKPALFILLLFAVPAASAIVPGFGGIRNFLALYPFNVLAVVILFPLLLLPRENKGAGGVGALADFCFIGFSALTLALSFRDTSLTDGIRQSTAYVLTAFGPYLVFSRVNWTLDRMKLATLAYVIPFVAFAGVAAAEVVLGWHVYRTPVDHWGIGFFSRYLERSGFLRAYGSVLGPITFGMFMAVAFALLPALVSSAKKKFWPQLAFAPLAVGLIASFSRGPWVGAALAIIAIVLTSDRPFRNMVRAGLVGLAAFAVLMVTPVGDEIVAMLPFVGEVEETTIDYRERLFEVGWGVAMQNPLFGSENYIDTPEMQTLTQGQGIIDLVNSYLRVVLETGLVGLALFVGVSGFSLLAMLRAIGAARRIDPELAAYCQSWFGALLGVMLILATTTNIVAQVAEVHWMLCGICVGAARSVALAVAAGKTGAAPAPMEEAPPPDSPSPAASVSAGRLPPHLRQYGKR